MARILVIDDDEFSRSVLRALLESMGHGVIEAQDGKEGFESFRRREIDLIITDLFMPPEGGLSVIRNVRKIDRDVKIVVVSGMASENRDLIFEQTIEAGAITTLEKPIDPGKFRQLIGDLLGAPSA